MDSSKARPGAECAGLDQASEDGGRAAEGGFRLGKACAEGRSFALGQGQAELGLVKDWVGLGRKRGLGRGLANLAVLLLQARGGMFMPVPKPVELEGQEGRQGHDR